MPGLVDIHSHIIPQVDDGARSLEQAINMVKKAYEEGIRTMVATPHYKVDRCECTYEAVSESYNSLKKAIESEYEDFQLYIGNEIMFSDDIPELIEKEKVMTLADSNYVLVEFMPSVSFKDLKEGLYRISLTGKTPILAHIERYLCLLENKENVYDLKDMGVCTQINSKSVTGEGGRTVKKFLKFIFKERLADIIATDTHSDGNRSPYMKDSYRYISKKFGEDYARMIYVENPENIINNKYIN